MATVKGKFHPRTAHEGPEGDQKYSFTLSLTSALDGVGGQSHSPATLTVGKTRYPLYGRLGGPHGRSELVRKIQSPLGFDPRTVQLVASRYIVYAIPAHEWQQNTFYIIAICRMIQKEFAVTLRNVPQGKLHRYNQQLLYSKFKDYRDNGEGSFKD